MILATGGKYIDDLMFLPVGAMRPSNQTKQTAANKLYLYNPSAFLIHISDYHENERIKTKRKEDKR